MDIKVNGQVKVNIGIRIPSKSTLKKYGLSEADYLGILERQNLVCPICKKSPKNGKFVIDHYHHPKYKQLPPPIRKAFVRGCLCWYCNYFFLPTRVTVTTAQNLVNYLKDFEKRKPR